LRYASTQTDKQTYGPLITILCPPTGSEVTKGRFTKCQLRCFIHTGAFWSTNGKQNIKKEAEMLFITPCALHSRRIAVQISICELRHLTNSFLFVN